MGWQVARPRFMESPVCPGHAIATGKPGEVVPGLEGEFCAIRESTAKMGIRRMTSLIEYSQAFAVQNGVQLREVRYSGDYFGRVA
jgi:hypothetical protein